MATRLGRTIRQHRTAWTFTQHELARRAVVTQGLTSQLEGGMRANTSVQTVRRLAGAFSVPVAELLEL